jgi:DNA-binding GntR family transcriptional regulator
MTGSARAARRPRRANSPSSRLLDAEGAHPRLRARRRRSLLGGRARRAPRREPHAGARGAVPLRNEGFLDVEPKLGWFVQPIDFAKLEQLYDLRVVLELASVLQLCSRAEDAAELDALKAIWLVPAAERLDRRATGRCERRAVPRHLVRAAGNDEMARVHWDVTERIRIIRRLDFTRLDRIEATYTEHAKILRAVIQRKADQAQLLLKSHIEQSKVEVRKISCIPARGARQDAR